MNAAYDLGTALSAVKETVQVPGHFAQVFFQRRRVRVEGCEEQAFVTVQLGHWYQIPLTQIQFAEVGILQVGNGHQVAIVGKGPAVVGAG